MRGKENKEKLVAYGSEESLLSFSADRHTIVTSSFHSVIIQLLLRLKGLITMPIVTYYLLPQEMGIYNLIVVTATMLTPIFYLNLADGPAIYLVQEKSKDRIRSMYNTVVNSSFLIFVLCSIIFSIIILKFNIKFYNYFYLVLALIFSNIFYKLFSYILVTFQKTSLIIKNTLFRDIFAIFFAILLIVAGFSYKGIIYADVLASIITGILIYNIIRTELALRWYIEKTILLKFLKIALPLLPVFFFSWLVRFSGSYFVLFFKGTESVGKYAVICGLCSVISIFTWALNFFWFPVSAKLWIEDREKYRNYFTLIFTLSSLFLLLVILLFELNSKIIVHLLARKAAYFDAYVITGIIASALSMEILTVLLTAPLYSNHNPKHILISFIIGGLLNSLCSFAIIPSLGILGAAISMAFAYLAVVLSLAYFNYRVAKFPFLDKRLIYVLFIFSISWPFIAYMREQLTILEIFLADVFLISMVAYLIYVKFFTEQERAFLFSLVRKDE